MGYILTDTSPAYELVGDITVSSATTSVSFTGLNFTSADDLLLVTEIKNPSSQTDYFLYANGNTTRTNYWTQLGYAVGAGAGAIRSNSTDISQLAGGASMFAYIKIKLTNSGHFVFQDEEERQQGTSSPLIAKYYGTSTFTSSSITSLTISGNIANQIGTGSRFRLYKLVAEKVADITVSTATTSVDITGLSIDKGSEYMLVSDISPSSGTYYSAFFNGNNTVTNYYAQRLTASGTSIDSSRANTSVLCQITSSTQQKTLAITNIKLTNNGNCVFQSNTILSYSSASAIMMESFNNTSTFTTNSISQITISGANTNSIGVGSRFQLYKLR